MTQLERLQEYYDRSDESLVLTGNEFDELKVELETNTDINDYYKNEILTYYRYFGRGFAVDYSDYVPPVVEDPTPAPEDPPVDPEPEQPTGE